MAEHSSKRPGQLMPTGPDHAPGDRSVTSLGAAGQICPNDAQDRGNQPEPKLDRPMTIAEVARHYRMSERTVRRRIKDGTLQKELGQGRLVRISVEQLRKLSKGY